MREHCVLPPRTRQDLVELEAQTRRALPPLVYTSLEEISPIRVERERERLDRHRLRSFSAPFPISREPGLLGVHGSVPDKRACYVNSRANYKSPRFAGVTKARRQLPSFAHAYTCIRVCVHVCVDSRTNRRGFPFVKIEMRLERSGECTSAPVRKAAHNVLGSGMRCTMRSKRGSEEEENGREALV